MARRAKKRYGWLWAGALFFSAGYLITAAGIPPAPHVQPSTAPATATRAAPPAAPAEYERLGSPLYAMVALVALTIPFAARTRGLLAGALRGAGMGAAGAAGIAFGLSKVWWVDTESVRKASLLAAMTSVLLCAAAGAVFALLAQRRHRRLFGG